MSLEYLAPWEKDDIRKKIEKLKQELSENKTNSKLMGEISDYFFQIDESKLGQKYLEMAKEQENIDFPEFLINRNLLNERILRERIEYKKTQH